MPLQLTTRFAAIAALQLALCISANAQVPGMRLLDSKQSEASGDASTSSQGLQGVLEPWKTCEVACSETGLLQTLEVGLGHKLKAGDRIASLNSDAIELQLQIAELQAAAIGKVETAKAEVRLNVRKVEAFTDARRKDYGSQLELDRAEMELATSRGRLTTETEELSVLQLRVAQLRQALKDRIVVAPIDGQVTEIHREVGELVTVNAPEIVRIVDISKLRARFYLTEQEVDKLPQNQSVTIELASGKMVPGTIEDIAPVADKESGLIVVSVLIDNLNSDIRSSRCTLQIGQPTL